MIPKPKNCVLLRIAVKEVVRRETGEVTASEMYPPGASFPPLTPHTLPLFKEKLGKVMKYSNTPPTAIPQGKCLVWWTP